MVTCSAAPFLSRHLGYKVGVILLFALTLAFLFGNLRPQWICYSNEERNIPLESGIIYYRYTDQHSSVLWGCSTIFQNGSKGAGSFSVFFSSRTSYCGSGYSVESAAGASVRASQAFEAMGIIALVSACIYTVWDNFVRPRPCFGKRCVEIATVSAGVLGFIGTMIFVGKLATMVRSSELYSFAWSLHFTIVISIIVIIVGAVIAFFNGPASGDYSEFSG